MYCSRDREKKQNTFWSNYIINQIPVLPIKETTTSLRTLLPTNSASSSSFTFHHFTTQIKRSKKKETLDLQVPSTPTRSFLLLRLQLHRRRLNGTRPASASTWQTPRFEKQTETTGLPHRGASHESLHPPSPLRKRRRRLHQPLLPRKIHRPLPPQRLRLRC